MANLSNQDIKGGGFRPIARLYLLHAYSPLHVGTGEGLGAINLPTARETATGYPCLPGSSVKGVLRDLSESSGYKGEETWTAFGPPQEHAASARGGLVFSDASLLALPVRSLFGTFAWVTCPFVLNRMTRDAREADLDDEGLQALSQLAHEDVGGPLVSPTNRLVGKADAGVTTTLFLEDVPLGGCETDSRVSQGAKWLAERVWSNDQLAHNFFAARFLVLPDDLFGYFSRSAMEIRNRVKIDSDTGTAARSGPWTEEYLPAETLLHGLILGRATAYKESEQTEAQRKTPRNSLDVLKTILGGSPLLRFGGKSSGGSGRARLYVDGL